MVEAILESYDLAELVIEAIDHPTVKESSTLSQVEKS